MEANSIIVHRGEIARLDNSIRFVCLSDTHNRTSSLEVPPGDVLLHSGDFSRRGEIDDIIHFNSFLAKLPHRYKVVIAGNHEISFDLHNERMLKRGFKFIKNVNFHEARDILKDCIYLEDTFCIIGNYKIYGSPWLPRYNNSAFNIDGGSTIRKK